MCHQRLNRRQCLHVCVAAARRFLNNRCHNQEPHTYAAMYTFKETHTHTRCVNRRILIHTLRRMLNASFNVTEFCINSYLAVDIILRMRDTSSYPKKGRETKHNHNRKICKCMSILMCEVLAGIPVFRNDSMSKPHSCLNTIILSLFFFPWLLLILF